MLGEIIAIGDELTSGRITNTTSGFAAHHLFEAGFDIYAMHTIGDTPTLIGEALKRALKRVDFVLVTGGLGPTDDDLTTEAVSEALNRPTMPDLELLSLIRNHLEENSDQPPGSLDKLAWLPEGAETLKPGSKMAGFQLIHRDKPIFFLPGIPHQMRTLLVEQVLPRLATWYHGRQQANCQRVYKIFGKTEQEINLQIEQLELGEDVTIGYYPVFPDVHLSVIIRGNDQATTQTLAEKTFQLIERHLDTFIYGRDQESMASVVGKLLTKQQKTFSVAESCTGGLISHLMTSVAGSSSYYLGGITSYANSMKETYLGVEPDLLERTGAVSPEVAKSMVQGMRSTSKADLSISITGIAGPGGGSEEKPVGTVFIGLAYDEKTDVQHFLFSGNRYEIQYQTAQTALNLVRHCLLKNT